MDLRVPRIDPSRGVEGLSWSADGVLAIACQSNVVLYEPDAHVLCSHPYSLKWHRHELSGNSAPITDISWSRLTRYGCFLAALSSNGELWMAWNTAKETWTFEAPLGDLYYATAIAWTGQRLFVGNDLHLRSFDLSIETDHPHLILAEEIMLPTAASGSATHAHITRIVVSQDRVTALLMSNNSLWSPSGDQIIESSSQLVSSLLPKSGGDSEWIVARPGYLQVSKSEKIDVGHLGLVYLLTIGGSHWIGIGDNGSVYNAPPSLERLMRQKKVQQVWGVSVHPFQPVLALLYAPSTAQAANGEWQAPIMSSMVASVLLWAYDTPDIRSNTRGNVVGTWMAHIIANKDPETIEIPPLPPLHRSLRENLRTVATSATFDALRAQWWMANEPEAREKIVHRGRCLLAEVLSGATPHTPIDEAVLRSYAGLVDSSTESKQIIVSGGFFEEQFEFGGIPADTIESLEGHTWRRCAITLLPIMTLDSLESADRNFTTLPNVAGSVIAASLLDVLLDFCVFTGTQWQKRS